MQMALHRFMEDTIYWLVSTTGYKGNMLNIIEQLSGKPKWF